MKARVTEMLQGLQIVNNTVIVTFTEVEKVDGDMTAMNRKGKTYTFYLCRFAIFLNFRKYVYDFNIKVKWKGEYVLESGDKVEGSGSLELIDVMVDDDDYPVC
jgi:activator of HSP90 ATPase